MSLGRIFVDLCLVSITISELYCRSRCLISLLSFICFNSCPRLFPESLWGLPALPLRRHRRAFLPPMSVYRGPTVCCAGPTEGLQTTAGL